MGETAWGVWLDSGQRWYEDHKGNPKPYSEAEARAVADTLNWGEMSGRCEARPLPGAAVSSST